MALDKSIQIKNIYYMLSYTFRVLRENNYKYIEAEEFDNIYDLLSEILYRGVSYQLKQGLHKEYVLESEDLETLKGRINFNESIKLITQKKQRLNCSYDEYSENTLLNQIIKTTIIKLIGVSSIETNRRNQLNSLRMYFDGVSLIDHKAIKWSSIVFDRNNQNYKMLINLCYFILNNLLLTEKEGKYKLASFTDEQMNLVFQNFVFNYYKEYIKKNDINGRVRAAKISYSIDQSKDNIGIEFLPEMNTDITVDVDDKTLIIDTKYYGKVFQSNFEKDTYHNSNIYQIQSYVMHQGYNSRRKVSGMLLYAKTNEEIKPDTETYDMDHWFYVKTLDLNKDFIDIKKQLNEMFDLCIYRE